MPEEEVDTFKCFQYWLYSGKLVLKNQRSDTRENEAQDETEDKTEDDGWSEEWDILVKIFLLAEARGIAGLQNAVIDVFIDIHHIRQLLYTRRICKIYQHTSNNSPLRRLVVDMTQCCAHMDEKIGTGAWFTSDKYKHLKKEFLFDLAVAYCKRVNGQVEKIKDFRAVRTNYHIPLLE